MLKKGLRSVVVWMLSATIFATTTTPYLIPTITKAQVDTQDNTVVNSEAKDDYSKGDQSGAFEKKELWEIWHHIKAGPKNGNAITNAAMLMAKESKITTSADISLDLKIPDNVTDDRFGVYVKYVDQNNWLFVGLDAGHWFYEYKIGGEQTWPKLNITSIPIPDETFHLQIQWEGSNLTVIKDGIYKDTVRNTALSALTNSTVGKVGFKAGRYGEEYSDAYFKDVVIKGQEGRDYTWLFLHDFTDQVYETSKKNLGTYLHLDGDENHEVVIKNDTVKNLYNGSLEFQYIPMTDKSAGDFGVKFRTGKVGCYGAITCKSDGWYYETIGGASEKSSKLGEAPLPKVGQKIKLELNEESLKIYIDQQLVLDQVYGEFKKLEPGSFAFFLGKGSQSINLTDIHYTILPAKDVIDKEGWIQEEKGWRYYEDNVYKTSTWLYDKQYAGWYYVDAEGYMLTDWQFIDGDWYYLGEHGERVSGWQEIKGVFYYFQEDGKLQTNWKNLNGIWYYFSDNGEMATDWKKIHGIWYYFGNDGKMATDWRKIQGIWYYFDTNGKMQVDWKKIKGTWFSFTSAGKMRVGWHKIDGEWYYFSTSGKMRSGWQRVNGAWYYLSASGKMRTGWQRINKKWYCLDWDGKMLTGWIPYENLEYYLSTYDGAWTGGVRW